MKNEIILSTKYQDIYKYPVYDYEHITCNCGQCNQAYYSKNLIKILEKVLNKLPGKIEIHSFNRCIVWNNYHGGDPKSLHMFGRAIDFHVIGVKAGDLHSLMLYDFKKDFFALGLYDWGVHIDDRGNFLKSYFWDSRVKLKKAYK